MFCLNCIICSIFLFWEPHLIILIQKYCFILNIFSSKTRLADKIAVKVKDLQTSLPLIYESEFTDYKLRIGDNILSQNWRTKNLPDSNSGGRFRQICMSIYNFIKCLCNTTDLYGLSSDFSSKVNVCLYPVCRSFTEIF